MPQRQDKFEPLTDSLFRKKRGNPLSRGMAARRMRNSENASRKGKKRTKCVALYFGCKHPPDML